MKPTVENVLASARFSSQQVNSHRVFAVPQSEIDAQIVRRWHALAERSCDGNPFLLPDFVLTSWKYLAQNDNHVLIIVANSVDGSWLAAGVFKPVQLTLRMPIPHLVASQCRHTFRTGLLWDAERGAGALDSMLKFLADSTNQLAGLKIPSVRMDSRLFRELEAAVQRQKYLWQATCDRQVPCIFPQIVSDDYVLRHWSKNRRKTHRRNLAQLEKHGEVSLSLARSPGDVELALETFLRLESNSWKGEAGTACLSTTADEAFIREMVSRLSIQGNVIISELRVGSRVVASALNLVAGTSFYAFKIGWDRDFAFVGPGILHECELLLQSSDRLSAFTLIDSCSAEDSYLADYWPERIPIGQVVICWSPLSEVALHLSDAARSMKRLLASLWR
ncbi:MAG: GNAT family N-acetyltransferase [Planctomycetota bacterium]